MFTMTYASFTASAVIHPHLLRRFFLCALAALCLALSAFTAGPGDWAMFHRDIRHTGRSPFNGPAAPTLKWAKPFTTGGIIQYCSASIAADGTVYVGANDGKLYAISPSGVLRWANQLNGAVQASPAIGRDGTVYVATAPINGTLYAINPDGTQQWSYPIGNYLYSSPTVAPDGTIYIGSYDASLYAINPNGTLKWSFATGSSITYSSVAIGTDGTVYIGSYDGYLYAINPDGTKQWAFATVYPIYSSPAIGVDGTIYVGANDGKLYAVNTDGTEQWAYPTGGVIYSAPAIGTDGVIYVGSQNNSLSAIYPDGKKKWTVATGNSVYSSPLIGADGTVYVGCNDNKLYAVNAAGVVQWTFPTQNQITASPALTADGTLYIGSNDSNLYAIGTPGVIPALSKAVAPTHPKSGETVTYTLTYTNNGSATGTNAMLTDVLPSGITYVDGSATGNTSFDAGSRTLTWSLGALNVSATAQTVTFQAIVNAAATGVNIVNTAAIWCTEAPTPVLSNPASVTISLFTVTPSAGTNGTITPSAPRTVGYGGSVSFTAAANSGYTVDRWFLDGLAVQGGGAGYTLPFVMADHAVKVTFTNSGGSSAHGDWWMFHHDIKHTGRSPFTGPATPRSKWLTPFLTGNVIYSSPAIGANGTIYVGSNDHNLYAINPDGTQQWVFTTGNSIYSSPAIGADGTIYVGSRDAFLYALNPDGTKKWAFATGNYLMYSSPTIGADGTIYIGSYDHNVYAINPDGTPKWSYSTGNYIYSSPAIGADGTIYIGSYDKYLYALNPDGTLKWRYLTGGAIAMSSPAIGVDGTIYLGALDNKLYALNPDGTTKWTYATGNSISSTPAIGTDGTIYVGSRDTSLYAVNPDGTKKWSYATGGYIYSSPVIGADGTVYVGSYDHALYALNPDGAKLWSFFTGGYIMYSSPAIGADGTIYIGSYDRKLYAIGTATPTLALTKTVSTRHPQPGDTVTYTLNCANIGAATATNAVLTDALPTGISYLAGSANGVGSYNTANNTLTWMLGDLNTKATASVLTFQAVIASGVANGTNITNTATLSCQEQAMPKSSSITLTVNRFTIMPTAGPNGTITPSTPQTVGFGASVAFTAAANAGDTVDSWFLDGRIVQIGGDAWTLTGITADHTVKVTFRTDAGPAPAGNDWWMFHHDRLHTGCTAFTGPAAPGARWAQPFATNGPIYSSPAIGVDGTVYVGSNDGNLYAINPDSTAKWTQPVATGGSIVYSSPAIGVDGTIYVGSYYDFSLHAVNPDGTNKWTFATTSYIDFSSPVIGTDGTIYIGSNDCKLYAVNPDGTAKWSFTTGGAIMSSPAIAPDGTVYFGSEDYKLYAVNSDGTAKWAHPFATGSNIYASPAIGADGTIYVGSYDHNLYAVNPDGTAKWAHPFATGNYIDSSPAIGADGTIYIGSWDTNLYAVATDGTKKWAYATGGAIIDSSPAIGADGTVYVGSSDAHLHAVKPDGSRLWSFATRSEVHSSPALGADGTLYVGGTDAKLYAIGVSMPQLTLTKTVSTLHPKLGETVTYTLNYANVGFATATNVVLTDKLPAGLGYVNGSASATCSYDTATSTLTWTLGDLGPTTTVKTAFQAIITAARGSAVTNSAVITCTELTNPALSNTVTLHVTPWLATPSAGAHGAIAPNTPQWVDDGTGILFNAVPDSGYQVDTWSLDGHVVQTGGTTFMLPYVTADHTVNVTFTDKPAPTAQRGDWWMYQHDAQHTGRSPVAGPASPMLKWAQPFIGTGAFYSGPSLGADGTLYAGTEAGYLYAITSAGALKWGVNTQASIYSSPAIAVDGTIYCATYDGKFYALNPDGSRKWVSSSIYSCYYGLTLGLDGTIFFGAEDGRLYAYNPDGTIKWIFTTDSSIYCAPVIGTDGVIYCGSDDGNLYAINPDGSKRWALYTNTAIEGFPTIGPDGTIYAWDTNNHLLAVTPDGVQKWAYSPPSSSGAYLAIGMDGTLYSPSSNGTLNAINPDGTTKWSTTVASNGVFCAPAIDANGTVYVGTDDGTVYAVNPDGTPRWQYQTNYAIEGSFAIDQDGSLYVGTLGGSLHAFSAHPASALSLTKSVTPTKTVPGGSVNYTLVVTNNGGATATNVVLTDALPAGITYTSGSAIGSYNSATNTLTWSLDALVNGATTAVTFQATVNADQLIGANISNTATVSCTEVAKPVVSNTAVVSVSAPALSLTKRVAPSAVKTGDVVTYSLLYKNTGGTATGTTLTDALPAGITYLPGSAGVNAAYNTATNTVIWTLGTQDYTVTPRTVTFQATVNAGLALGAEIANTASIFCVETPTPLVSNPAYLTIAAPSLALKKSLSAATAKPDDILTYTLSFTNNSAVTASNITLTDILPAGVSYQSCSNPTAAFNTATNMLTITPDPLIGWATAHVDMKVQVNWDAIPGTNIVNTASIFCAEVPTPVVSNSVTFLVNAPMLTLTKDVTVSAARPGDPVIYTLTCGNHGNQPATNVTVTDLLPDGVSLASGVVSIQSLLQNTGFETPIVGNGYQYNPTGAGWTFTGSSGVTGNSSGFTAGNPTAPEGNQVAFLQSNGAISQDVTLAGGFYLLTFQAGQRGNYNTGPQDFQVLVDGVQHGWFTPTNGSYAAYTTDVFTVAAGVHTILFRGIDTGGGDRTAFIDNIQLINQYYAGTVFVGPLGTINAGATATVTLQVNVNTTATAGVITNIATATCAEIPSPVTSNLASFTVIGAVQPDLSICSPVDNVYVGANIFNTDGAGQTMTQQALVDTTVHYLVKLKNVGSSADSFLVTAPAPSSGWKVHYIDCDSGKDITTSLSNGGWTTRAINPNASLVFTLHITPTHAAAIAVPYPLLLTAQSMTDTKRKDATQAISIVPGKFQPDLSICNATDQVYVGYDIFTADGTGQTVGQSTAVGTTVTYFFLLQNRGTTGDSFLLTAPQYMNGWRAQFVDCSTGKDITAAITGRGWKSPVINPNARLGYTIHLTPGGIVPAQPTALLITAVSSSDGTKSDAVTAVTTVSPQYQPDLGIACNGDARYTGFSVFNTDGDGQTKGQTVGSGTTATYLLQVKNVGNTADTVTLTCSALDSGWKLQIVDRATGKDITAAMAAGVKVSLTYGTAFSYTIHITPAAGLPAGTMTTLTVTAVSGSDGTKHDVVKAITTVAPSARPDLAVCNFGDASYLGLGVFNTTGTGQTKSQTVANGGLATYLFQVKNDGNTTDTLILSCPSTVSGWTVQVVDQATGKDITASMAAGIQVTLAQNAVAKYTLHLTPGATVSGAMPVVVTAVSMLDGTKKDVVKTVTTVPVKYQPDLAVCNYSEASYTGLGTLNLDGTGQTKSQTTTAGTMVTYLFAVKNNGNTSDTFTLTCPLPGASGWTVQCVDRATGKDITTAVKGKGAVTTLVSAGAFALFTVHVTPSAIATTSPYPLLITATSTGDNTKQDAVKLVTTKQ